MCAYKVKYGYSLLQIPTNIISHSGDSMSWNKLVNRYMCAYSVKYGYSLLQIPTNIISHVRRQYELEQMS